MSSIVSSPTAANAHASTLSSVQGSIPSTSTKPSTGLSVTTHVDSHDTTSGAIATPSSKQITYDRESEKWRFGEEDDEGKSVAEVSVPFERFIHALSGFRHFKMIVKDALRVFLFATEPAGILANVDSAVKDEDDEEGAEDEDENEDKHTYDDHDQGQQDSVRSSNRRKKNRRFDEQPEDYDPFSDPSPKRNGDLSEEAQNEELKVLIQSCEAFSQAILAHEPAVYHQELTAVLMDRAMDLSPSRRRRCRYLLHYLVRESSVVSPNQLAHCLRRLRSRLPDLEIDCPQAEAIYNEFLYGAIVHGLLSARDASELKEPSVTATELREGKIVMMDILKDFYDSFDSDSVSKRCQEELRPALHSDFIKRIVSTAFDKSLLCHEAASQLIARLSGGTPVSTDSTELGFQALLQQSEDLQLDVPDLLHRLALFIARAISDEALPPSFLDRLDLGPNDLGAHVTALAAKLLAQDREYHFLSECWEIQSATLAGAQRYSELLTRWNDLRLTPRAPISAIVFRSGGGNGGSNGGSNGASSTSASSLSRGVKGVDEGREYERGEDHPQNQTEGHREKDVEDEDKMHTNAPVMRKALSASGDRDDVSSAHSTSAGARTTTGGIVVTPSYATGVTEPKTFHSVGAQVAAALPVHKLG